MPSKRCKKVLSNERASHKIIADNRLVWDVKTILKMCLKRWKIDSFYRDVKQETGLENYVVGKMRAVGRHWFMVFLVHALLWLSLSLGKPLGWIKIDQVTVGSRCRYAAREMLESFVILIVKLIQKVRTSDEILRYALSYLYELNSLY